MKLQKEPFEKIAQGTKTIELRLNDEKRKKLEIGDKITFSLIDNPNTTLKTKVTGLFPYKSFEELFRDFPPEATGSNTRDDWMLMRQYYSEEDEKKYGVLGIEVKPLD